MQESGQTKKLFTYQELLQSIQKELEDIFGTRSSFSVDDLQSLLTKVSNEAFLAGIPGIMGFPTTSNIFLEDLSSWGLVERQCELMIRLFESRILSPRVNIAKFDTNKQELILKITGTIVCRNRRELASFSIAVRD
ncbi:MAG: hypothetical protein LBF72_04125 [Holosporales bacterium]|nr:hypothetical protein [Holosporales bacterium]